MVHKHNPGIDMPTGVYPRASPAARFYRLTQKTPGCWFWRGTKRKSGYGHLSIQGKLVRAHRFSWFLHYGVHPGENVVMHMCDTPLCVNPHHLRLGSQKENLQDMSRKGRAANQFGKQKVLPNGKNVPR